MHDELPPALRAKLDAFSRKKPQAQELIDKLLVKRAASTSDSERQFIEKMLHELVSPGRKAAIIVAAIGVFMAGVFALITWDAAQEEAALERSVPAVALVKRMDPGDCWVSTRTARCLRLELEVHRDGAPPYVGSLTDNIGLEWMSRVQPGSWLTIGVDPDDPNKLLFDERAMAVPPPTPPTSP
ncbi:hypothetical protein [Nannocystis radixulma]|uniref:Uncharacterized protein n=1 Tax=Nannocystis radixulma TaxID=2995305 RepID=A0ABT5BLF4_9BACT|nr:hypothetical protein [Nannocystis radixulma]MDC0674410.1 hypothetical protein [Nannocystis radixulma]